MEQTIISVECHSDTYVTLQTVATMITDCDGERPSEPELAMVIEDAISEEEICIPVFFTREQIDGLISKLRKMKKNLNKRLENGREDL